MQAKTSPKLTDFQKQPPPGPPPMPNLADMDKFHRLVASGKLEDVLYKLGGGK